MVVFLVLYFVCLCIPAFFVTYEWDSHANCFEGCWMVVIGILGFPGAILGFLIRSSKDAKDQAWREENKRRSEIAARERAQRTALLRTERIEYYTKSPLLPEIIEFITKHGIPYEIYVSSNAIHVYRPNGDDFYYFARHGINDLAENNVEVYALGHAINNMLSKQFTITEGYSDGTVSAVTLKRPLQHF